MSTINQIEDSQFIEGTMPSKIPSSLNTLTILTFIGCGLGLIGSIYSFATASNSYKKLEELQAGGNLDKVPGFMKGMVGPDQLELLRKMDENRIPILIISLVGVALCFFGALQMRSLKKQGYYLWILGELFAIVGTLIFIGFAVFSGFKMIGLIIPLIFIVLYTRQLKYLK